MEKGVISKDELQQRRIAQLKNLLAQHKQRFPEHLANRFPHILERILSSWNNEDKTRHYFKNLLAPESRYGFPPDALQEIFLLSKFYDHAHPPLRAKRADVWVGFTV